MNADMQATYDHFLSEIRKAQDALSRAIDGANATNWEELRLGYCQTQLCKANKYIIQGIELMNAEINGRREGEPDKAVVSVFSELNEKQKACPHNWLNGFCDLCGAIK